MGICCRHTRYTPGWGSWNPTGGFPELTEFPIIPMAERWQDIDDIQSSKGIQYCQNCESEKDMDEFMLVDQASDTTMETARHQQRPVLHAPQPQQGYK
eukprot:1862286-Amphidinium_carterae.1